MSLPKKWSVLSKYPLTFVLLGVLTNLLLTKLASEYIIPSSLPSILHYSLSFLIYLSLVYTHQTLLSMYSPQFLSGKKPSHLVIVQHGFVCHYYRMIALAEYILHCWKESNSHLNENIMIHVSRSNSHGLFYGLYGTHSGITVGGLFPFSLALSLSLSLSVSFACFRRKEEDDGLHKTVSRNPLFHVSFFALMRFPPKKNREAPRGRNYFNF